MSVPDVRLEAKIRILCDEMLTALARWLRAAGHDAAVAAPGATDASLIEQCRNDGRVLLTRDRTLPEAASGAVVALWLPSDDMDGQADYLGRELKIDWTAAPFSRCLVDNAPLVLAENADLERVPLQSRSYPGPIRKCPDCRRIYWCGGHAQRMLARLRQWSSRRSPSA